MRAFLATVRVIVDDNVEPSQTLLKRLRGQGVIDARLVGYSEEAMPAPKAQVVKPVGINVAEFGKF